MRWIFRYFLVCVSFTNLVIAEDQCRTEINIRGMALRGFVFKRIAVAAPHICDILCERQFTCQSYNFNRKEQICELNNRTKEARPENFHSDPAWFYIRRLNGRGNCRNLEFTSFPKPGYRLENHTVRTVEVLDEDICMLQCYLEPNCVSYNFHELKKGSNTHTCDLNNSTAEHDKELVESKNYTYRGAENACAKNPCKNNATCQAGFTDRDYQCLCVPRSGFEGHDCDEDIDECTRNMGKHSCEGNTTCNNTNGSYTCRCKHGYHGNGTNCTDIDECANRMHNCDVNAECNNTLGSYNCTCRDGFHGNGTHCTDIDECADEIHRCDVNTECHNTLGSYNCMCKYGCYGNGNNHTVKVWSVILCEGISTCNRICCENERKIDVVYANYGRLDNDTCDHPEKSNTNCSAVNSLSTVQTRCNGKVGCQLVATNSEFGDPCGGTYKYLEVKFKCVLRFTAAFTTLGASGTQGPHSIGSHYTGEDHDGQVTVSSGIQLWTVPHTGQYRIEAIGASGGYGEDSVIKNGGRGAKMIGNFIITKDEIIRILVGQKGKRGNTNTKTAGGGGGTFVVRGNNTPLIIAGGGGGIKKMTEQHPGCDASINTTGNAGYNSPLESGGRDGNGGNISGQYSGGGGGGFFSNGQDARTPKGKGKGEFI